MIKNNTIIIDQSKCTSCGNCIEVCGSNTLELENNSIIQKTPILCSSCGHCAAICPEDAISSNHENKNPFSVNIFDHSLSEMEKLMSGKRSVREYKNKEITKEVIEKWIYYAEKSPSSSNKRKRAYIVIHERDKILELEKVIIKKFNALKTIVNPFVIGLINLFSKKQAYQFAMIREDIKKINLDFEKKDYPIFRNAPCVICITAPKGAVQAKDDCIIAQQYMMLYAQSQGYGSCIIGYAQYAHKTLEKTLKVRKGYSVYAVLILGYPKYMYKKEIQYQKNPEVKWL